MARVTRRRSRSSSRIGSAFPIEQISIVHGDTDKVQMGMGTYGSRSGAVGMSAIVKALDKVVAKGKQGCRAPAWRSPEADVDFDDGEFSAPRHQQDDGLRRGGAAGLCRPQVRQRRDRARPEGRRVLRSEELHLPVGRAHREVEVDPETGVTRIDRWTAVDDFGILINPMIVEGQVHGGIAQGVGQAHARGCGLRRRMASC